MSRMGLVPDDVKGIEASEIRWTAVLSLEKQEELTWIHRIDRMGAHFLKSSD
jgi:hypothetical protein